MKPFLPATFALLLASAALAQDMVPGGHFVTNWDLDGDGAVSLTEATERRGDIFTTFDADGDGALTEAEYVAFDEARAADQAGMGKGHGMGHGNPEEMGMMRAFNDADGDGRVTREEFLARVPDWFAKMDRNADGAVTPQDFGPGN
ncbi:EF-hand domain-containing protein [Stagnihabitans tardus]|uniref:EF-hand domain-containing protein n=1 Tax=Stagnihabitans tardus TaxID=2699202 RepID=A0AAE4YC89_9RHOB|nr:EF-hand domain-containing protein [Stagnihabitans tardus]NBZ87265.1 EF-hand domain-containing protein [Stagnihabitans tardus]